MHVGLNLLYLLPGVVGGTETYAAGLLGGLAALDDTTRYTVFMNREAADWPLPSSSRFRRVVCPVRAVTRLERYRWEQLHFPALVRRSAPIDVLHSLGYVAPLRAPAPSVVTVHDLNYRAFGDRMPHMRRLMLQFFVGHSARLARRVITVSEFARREIAEVLGVPAARIVVTPHGAPRPVAASPAEQSELRRRFGIHEGYVLAFSSSTPNKNVPALLKAYALARREFGMRQGLVLVGHPPATGLSGVATDGVHVTGYVDEQTLRAIVTGADLLVFPSFYEGFGLPVLEAMAAGVPVACSRAASLPEVGGEAAVYFDPHSVPEIARTMASIACDAHLRHTLAQRGVTRAAEFTWERTAAATLHAYREALDAPLRDGAVPPGGARALPAPMSH